MRIFPLLAACLANAAPSQVLGIQLFPDADATIDQQAPTVNAGTGPNLDFGKYSNAQGLGYLRGLVHFDLTPVQNRAVPLRAILWWYQDPQRTVLSGCVSVSAHRVTQSWTETTVTWATAPLFDLTREATTSVGGMECTGWRTFDLSSLFQGWWTNQWPNDGLVIRDPNETPPGLPRPGLGNSRENPATGQRPYVQLRWDLPYGQGCGTGPTPPVLALTSGEVALGAAATMTGAGFPGGAPSVLLFGISDMTWMGFGLPYNLGTLGYPLCYVLASGEALIGAPTTGQGLAQWQIPVPNNPTLSGVDFYLQGLSFQGAVPYLTNGLVIRPY